MNKSRILAVATLLLLACGGGDSGTGPGGGGNNPARDPVPTAPGVPDGAPTTATIGPGGGALASSDGMFTLDVPAGALGADTDITIQPITNTAWGGTGKGYRLIPDGLTFATPVELVFELTDELLTGTDADFVDVAVQRDDGVWGILKNRTLDEAAGTLTCTTTHFSDYSLVEGVQIRPAAAVVDVNQTLQLHVRYCSRDPIPGDPDLVSLLITCDEELVPLGTFRNWSVNGVVGGNSTFGRVTPTSGPQTTFTAPAVQPNPNTVAASVEARYNGMQALLVCNITIGGQQWEGEITAIYPGGDKTRALITWVYLGGYGTQQWFRPVGPVIYTLGAGDCAFVSLTPDAYVFVETDGIMTIDYGVDPPAVIMGFGTFWDAEHCYQCPGHPVQCAVIGLSAGYYVNDVVTGANLDLIEALGVVEDDVSYTYTFRKVTPTP